MPRPAPKARGIAVTIPGRRGLLRIERVVFDFNGTLAVEGRLIRGVSARLKRLAALVDVVVLTADTFGTARRAVAALPVEVAIVRGGARKRRYVESIGREVVAAVGNGANDLAMLKVAALGIAVCGPEGMSAELLRTATIVVGDIKDALDLLLRPQRIVATLRR